VEFFIYILARDVSDRPKQILYPAITSTMNFKKLTVHQNTRKF